MATIKEIVQAHCRRTGIPVPNGVVGTLDAGVTQLQALLEELGEELASRFQWPQLRFEATFSSTGAEDQGKITDLTSEHFDRIVPGSMWNLTTRQQIIGPMRLQEKVEDAAVGSTSLTSSAYISAGHLYISPAPEAGNQIRFIWQTKAWLRTNTGMLIASINDDSNVPLFDADLLKLGLRWKWKLEKGLPYAEELRAFEAMALDKTARVGVSGPLSLAGPSPRSVGVLVTRIEP